ncbi:sugar kinase [Gracilibacillus salitolerans]|uniref:Sugar kinase n=1 Tax=Gracilibacillus salitolerans TaxID=2663022 RepID=A0A5Q2TGX1_9BACI|nr:sugar kinase [Gracilibacillus salitolerans]QGH33946.1 sugar kinase [Gracilibacillus salitolerans]
MQDVVTVGESMVVFTPVSSPMMRFAETFSKNLGGAETNVAIGLARLGHNVGWISKLGTDEFGTYILNTVRGEGIDVSKVKRDPDFPTGLYFKEIRNPEDIRVSYYRKGSAASTIQTDDIDETYIKNTKYLHVTGITPALSDSAYRTVIQMMQLARQHKVTVVFDPNLRRKLWSEEQAKAVLTEMVTLSDIVLPGLEEAHFLFDETEPEQAADHFLARGCETVIIKLGGKGAYLKTKNESEYIEGFPVKQVIDPIGAGDGFVAGFLSGMLDQIPLSDAVKRANAVGAMQTQVKGDYEGLPNQEELHQFMFQQDNIDVKR